MSGLVKKVGKVFKKVGKFVKKNWKYIAIAVAVYFTAGVALSYFGSTAAFASSMPGFGVGGIFSKAAVAIGFQGSSAVASGLSLTSGAFTGAATGAIAGAGATLAPVAATASPIAGAPAFTASQYAAAGGVQAAAGAAATTAGTAAAGMTATDALLKASTTAFKLQAASTLISTIGGLFGESESDIYEKKHNLQYGNAFGVGRDGGTESGWATSGGSEAFSDMGKPARAGDAPAGGQAPSPYLASMQQPIDAGGPFLPEAGGPQQPAAQSSDFIKKGYSGEGYMPYA
jgi:hypothetical protein